MFLAVLVMERDVGVEKKGGQSNVVVGSIKEVRRFLGFTPLRSLVGCHWLMLSNPDLLENEEAQTRLRVRRAGVKIGAMNVSLSLNSNRADSLPPDPRLPIMNQ